MSRDIFLRLVASFIIIFMMFALHRAITVTPRASRPALAAAQPLLVAHRGGAALAPENTLAAFQSAVDHGAAMIALDVRLSADGELAVIHDETVDRTTDGSGKVGDQTLAQIKALDAGYRFTPDGGATYPYRQKGVSISTLSEVLAAFPDVEVRIDVQDATSAAAERLANVIVAAQAQERVVVGSPHDAVLRHFRRLAPEVATVAGPNELRTFYILQSLGLTGLHRALADIYEVPVAAGRLRFDSPRFITNVHALNQKLVYGVVDDPAQMRRLLDLGADGIVTDRPDLARKVFSPSP